MIDGRFCFKKAQKYYDNGEFGLALKSINRALMLNNTNYWYYQLKGEILRMQNNYKGALRQYNKAISLNIKDDISYFCKGYLYFKQNKLSLALKYFNKTLKLYENYNIYYWKAKIYLQKKNFNLAIKNCNMYLKLSKGYYQENIKEEVFKEISRNIIC